MTTRARPDTILAAAVVTIVVLGLIILSSASSVVGYEQFDDPNYFAKNQLLFGVVLGGSLLYGLSRVHYAVWRRHAVLLLGITLALLFIVFLPGLGVALGGARRWISIGGFFLLQPSEVAKLTLLVYLATWLERHEETVRDFRHGVLPYLVLIGCVTLPILLQPDLGTASIVILTGFVLLFIAGVRWSHIIAVIMAGLSALTIFILIAPYRLARITTFLDPSSDPQGIGYHINQALLAIGSGGLFGLGLGRSIQKERFLPEVETDSIFAVYAEELGFILSLVLIILYVVIAVRGYRVARYAPDPFAKYLATGLTTWFVAQALINIATMVALLPLTGITLPFVSYGRSSIVMTLAGVGILLNISRYSGSPEPRLARHR